MTKRRAVMTAVLIALLGGFGWSVHATLRRAVLGKWLVSAVDRFDVPAVRQLLDEGADPDTREGGDPPLDWHASLAALLGRAPRYERSLGTPLLCTAAYGGGPDSETGREIVTLLLAKGADVNARSDASETTYMGSGAIPGETALLDAVARSQGPIVRTLLDAGVNINAQGANGDTALSYAALGDPSNVRLLSADHFFHRQEKARQVTALLVQNEAKE
jgi:hypothetical protein